MRRVAVIVGCFLAPGCGTLLGTDDEPPPAPIDAGESGEGGEGGPVGADATTDVAIDAMVDAPAPAPVKRIFVTEERSLGNMDAFGTGVSGADDQCLGEARAAGLTGTYVAWLSAGAVAAIARLPQGVRWTLPDGTTTVFASTAAIAMGTAPAAPLDRKANGEPLSTLSPRVWTGTTSTGEKAALNCADWSSAAAGATGMTGVLGATTAQWTEDVAVACGPTVGALRHVLCFEQ